MPTHVTPWAISILIAIAIDAILIRFAWQRRRVPGALALIGVTTCFLEYSLTYLLNITASDLPSKVLWAKIGYIGTAGCAPAWLVFCLEYTGADKWLTRRNILLLFLIPLAMLGLVFTNEHHWLVWSRVWLDGQLQVAHGPAYWAFIAYVLFLILLGITILLRMLVQSPAPYRWQIGAVIVGAVAIINWVMLYLVGPDSLPKTEITPFILILSGLAFGMGMFYYRLFSILPIAREVVIENMHDGLIVVDPEDHIADLNPAAQAILGTTLAESVGCSLSQVWSSWTDIQANPDAQTPAQVAIQVAATGCRRYFEILTSTLNRQGRRIGRSITLHDITVRKQAEESWLEQRNLAEALRESAAVLNSTLDQDEIFDRILTILGKVIPHDAANIMLLENGVARIARSQGYESSDPGQALSSLEMFVHQVPTLRIMVETGQPLVVSDTHTDPRWVDIPATRWSRSYAGVPIRSKNEVVGFLHLDSLIPGFYQPKDVERLQAFADQVAIAIENARLYAQVQQLARTDSLTGLNNRRALFELGQAEVERAQRYDRPLTALMLDIDLFKEINDHYGHILGDQILLTLVERCRENLRSADLIGRYGGDEFVILLLESDLTAAHAVAERLRQAMEQTRVASPHGEIGATISIGIATLGGEVPDFSTLVQKADQALYLAKNSGRNRTGVQSDAPALRYHLS